MTQPDRAGPHAAAVPLEGPAMAAAALEGATTDVAVASHRRARGLLLVAIAGLLYASAGLFVRALTVDAWTMLAWRSLAGGLATMVLLVHETGRLSWRDYALDRVQWAMVPVGVVATVSYLVALTLTTVADVMIVYATTPFVTAGIAWLWIGERPTRRLMVASTVALAGVVVMIGGGGVPSAARVMGAALVLLMNISFSMLLVLARRSPSRSMTPLNALSLLLASLIGFAVAPQVVVGVGPLLMMMLFGVLTLGLAMALFMEGARQAPAAEVALVGISDVVLGPLMVFAVFGENPGVPALIGGMVVLGAVVWNIAPDLRRAFNKRARANAAIL